MIVISAHAIFQTLALINKLVCIYTNKLIQNMLISQNTKLANCISFINWYVHKNIESINTIIKCNNATDMPAI